MEQEREERRLTTILSADVVGYSRLMAADEPGTLNQLKVHRKELIEPKAAEYRGRTVKLMGDGALMEFGSVVDAVLFAVEVQRAMAERNADIPADQQIRYRIGINIGDIIVVGDDIYGDGVNVAARLQALAKPGGIYIARNVYSQVKNKVQFGFQDLGEQKVKNIPEPVPAYEISWGTKTDDASAKTSHTRRPLWLWAIAAIALAVVVGGGTVFWLLFPHETSLPIEAASIEKMIFPLPEKPSIGVQAFDYSHAGPSDQLIAYGLTDLIIADLSHDPSLFVVAQDSSLHNKPKGNAPRDFAEQSGVRYVIMGKVVGNDEKLTVETKLIDATEGQQIWHQSLNGSVNDLYQLENKIVNRVRATLQDNPSDSRYQGQIPGGNSFSYLIQGVGQFWRLTPEGNKKAAQFFERATQEDPAYALAYAWDAWNDVFGVMMKWTSAPEEQLKRALGTARESVSLDSSLDMGRLALGNTFMLQGEHAKASEQFRRGLELTPDHAGLLASAAKSLAFQSSALEAIELGQRAIRLNPRPPDWYLWNLGIANYFAERYEDAIAILQKASTKDLEARLYLIASLIRSDRKSDAKFQANEIFQRDPGFHIARYVDKTNFADPNARQALVSDLLNAGVPENVSFPCMLEPTIQNCP